ncbi:MAG: hypothetical protein ACYC27_01200, partial [Armatimonadota bacterium]
MKIINCVSIVALCSGMPLAYGEKAGFEGRPPLDPETPLPRLLAPYDLAEINYLGMNYCENLLDTRLNITSYTHLSYHTNEADAWHLQFPDDTARLVECVAWEADYSPVARVEFGRRLTKGLIAAHYPGTKAVYSFRHRSGGKTYVILDDERAAKEGRVTLSTLGDSIEGTLQLGFRVQKNGEWKEISQFKYKDNPESAGNNALIRNSKYWNLSPFSFGRQYTTDGTTVDFTGRYWLSDEDMPIEYGFNSPDADKIQIVIGEPGKPMPLMPNPGAPGFIHLPDRKTVFSSADTGNKVFANPDFNFFILRKNTAWGTWGYSNALLVMWDGSPESIEAMQENGYGEIRFSYPKKNGLAGGKVWVYPFSCINDDDMEYIYRNAERFLSTGKMHLKGFPSQQMIN